MTTKNSNKIGNKPPGFNSPHGTTALVTGSSGMCGANPIKYHKGAVRAWEEAGYKIADCAKD